MEYGHERNPGWNGKQRSARRMCQMKHWKNNTVKEKEDPDKDKQMK